MEISEKRLKELRRAEEKLTALERGGVDNWQGYDEALAEYWAANELEEKKKVMDKFGVIFKKDGK